jgi:hypothetical protein
MLVAATPVSEPPLSYAKLIADIESCETLADLSMRAANLLKAKNKLSSSEAKEVEVAFTARSIALDRPNADSIAADIAAADAPPLTEEEQPHAQPITNDRSVVRKRRVGRPSKAETKTTATQESSAESAVTIQPQSVAPTIAAVEVESLAIPKLRYLRDKAHLKFVASHPCLICERSPADAHHVRFAQPQALGRKVSDEFTVPLCRAHHRDNHRFGDERAWWSRASIDPIATSRRLWSRSHRHIGDTSTQSASEP